MFPSPSMTITRSVLPNGIMIQLKEVHNAPIISHWIWYRVGSRNEQPGKTGLSHWVEHMQFKGTPTFPGRTLNKVISREGGIWNAYTHMDWTAYFETLPADKIDLALRLETDRMCNSLFDVEEVEAERTVILSEREGSENEPLFRLDEAVQRTAFFNHPYRSEVIGEVEDLRSIQRDDLFQHYRSFYVPNNAVVTLAGDFSSSEMLAEVEDIYGAIPAGNPPSLSMIEDTPIKEEQQVDVSGPGETTYIRLAYRAPAAAQEDFFSFTILDSLLSGPASLNMFGGGGTTNKTSRLYRALVERELAIGVSGGLQATIDPYLYSLTTTVNPRHRPQEVIEAIDQQIYRLQEEIVPDVEIRRAIKQARALFAYGSENTTNQAFWLGYAEMFDHYDWFEHYLKRLEQVTPEDVQRIARSYLLKTCRVVGIFHPDGRQAEVER